ncbi:rRNA processing protein Fyv7 [Schizosaccharomyces cryophilus OY26]|uniref:rRNA-processing protein FYV7 n=1 Tax=Schizosaccharomyces cryophilus (strain OY26 / ATCC MYA-4695 / CBS 11777 / NBRC 106824 / NRRL Y48691) TaxID=653667 RepID=S9XH38_SCHCR|nr:rRNA processing protein Fyv7 [Schizosaccharomyces cryophilus OY26]EPY52986.1 rRNA processing protein Fyv7 [Schizosaccharomyces cryophilus OY26]
MAKNDSSKRKEGFKFRVLPEHAYQGKAKKIKQDLILKAKAKKHYYKTVKPEEYGKKRTEEEAPKPTPRKNHLEQLYEVSEDKRRRKEEAIKKKQEKQQEHDRKIHERIETRKQLSKRTKHGQPVMKNQVSVLLGKVKKEMAS